MHVACMWHACDMLQLKTAEVEYSDVLMRWLVEREDRKKECSKSAISEDEGRRRVAVDNEMKYQVSMCGECGIVVGMALLWVWQYCGRDRCDVVVAEGVADDQRHVV